MRSPSVLVRFVVSAMAWMVALTLLWTQVSPWTSYPVAVLSHMALEQGAPMWVRAVRKNPGAMEVDTTIEMPVPQAGGRRAEIMVEVDPGRYAYGLPILVALLLAARGTRRVARALGGYLLLLPLQAFSLTFYVLMQMVLYAQASVRVLRVDAWQMEAIVYGYQVGSLLLPTLAPILLWLWFDQRFVEDVLIRSWRRHQGQQPPVPAAVPEAPTVRAPHRAEISDSPVAGLPASSLKGAGREPPR